MIAAALIIFFETELKWSLHVKQSCIPCLCVRLLLLIEIVRFCLGFLLVDLNNVNFVFFCVNFSRQA